MSTAAQIPPPPPGYTMDSATPPPPPGYTLDSQVPNNAQATGTISAAPPSFFSKGDTGQFLSNRADQLNQESQRQMYMANGPEAEGRSLPERAGHAALSVVPAAASLIDRAAAGLTDWKNAALTIAGAVDPAIPAAYFGTQGVASLAGVGQPSSAKAAVQNPTPDNVQRALTDASQVAGAGEAAELPSSGTALESAKLRGVRTSLPESRITKLIKPSAGDLKYGADPVQAITREGLTGDTLEDLGGKVYSRARDVGQTIDHVLAAPENAAKRVDITKAVNGPIQEAEAAAIRRGDRQMYTKLEDLRKQVNNVWEETEDKNGEKQLSVKGPRTMVVSPEEAVQIKRDIADMTRWSGVDPMENELNATKAAMFGRIKDAVNEAVPQVAELNQRYADLVSAGKAIERRAPVESRNASFSLGDIAMGGAGVLAGHSPAGIALTAAHKMARNPGVVTRAMNAIYPKDLRYEEPGVIRSRIKPNEPPAPGAPTGGGNGSSGGNAARDTAVFQQVQSEHPDWNVSQVAQEAARRVQPEAKGTPATGKPPQPERRAGARNGQTFTEAERQQFLARQRELDRALHPNPHLKENPFDHDELARELARRDTERRLKGGEDILSGRGQD